MQGRLYGLGRYPGAVPPVTKEDWVRGEVYKMDDFTALKEVLDEYEGADFERAITSVKLDDGGTVECWVYWYVARKPGRLIESGDWLA